MAHLTLRYPVSPLLGAINGQYLGLISPNSVMESSFPASVKKESGYYYDSGGDPNRDSSYRAGTQVST